MRGGSGRHAELAGELAEWWEDLWQRGMTSRVVLVTVPPGWGRTTVLDRLAEAAGADDAPITLIARINGRELPDAPGAQAAVLRDCLAEAGMRHPAAELLGLDRLSGHHQLSLGVGALFVSGLAAAVGFLVAGVAAAAAGKAWDDSPAGQDGALARSARAVAETSVRARTVVVIDDADWVDEGLAATPARQRSGLCCPSRGRSALAVAYSGWILVTTYQRHGAGNRPVGEGSVVAALAGVRVETVELDAAGTRQINSRHRTTAALQERRGDIEAAVSEACRIVPV